MMKTNKSALRHLFTHHLSKEDIHWKMSKKNFLFSMKFILFFLLLLALLLIFNKYKYNIIIIQHSNNLRNISHLFFSFFSSFFLAFIIEKKSNSHSNLAECVFVSIYLYWHIQYQIEFIEFIYLASSYRIQNYSMIWPLSPSTHSLFFLFLWGSCQICK